MIFDYDDDNDEDYDDHRTKAVVLHDIAGHLSKFSQISLPTIYRDVSHLTIMVMMMTMMMPVLIIMLMMILIIPDYLSDTQPLCS